MCCCPDRPPGSGQIRRPHAVNCGDHSPPNHQIACCRACCATVKVSGSVGATHSTPPSTTGVNAPVYDIGENWTSAAPAAVDTPGADAVGLRISPASGNPV